jgi:hypothetical protein
MDFAHTKKVEVRQGAGSGTRRPDPQHCFKAAKMWGTKRLLLPFFKLRSSCGLGSGMLGLIADSISRPQPSGTPRAGSTSFSGGESGAAGGDSGSDDVFVAALLAGS